MPRLLSSGERQRLLGLERKSACRTVNRLSIASSTGWPEGIRDPRLEGRGGHQHDGDFFHLLDTSMATLHPAGVHHGPQPGAAEGAAKKEKTDEVAVMVECLEPLVVSPAAEKASIDANGTSWAPGLLEN